MCPHREEFSMPGSSAVPWSCEELQLHTELCCSVTSRKTWHSHPGVTLWSDRQHSWGELALVNLNRLLTVSENRNGCRGVPRLSILLSWKPPYWNTILSCATAKHCTWKRRVTYIKYVCFRMQVLNIAFLDVHTEDVTHGNRAWCHTRWFTRRKCCYMCFLFLVSFCIKSFHCQQLKDLQAGQAGEAESKHTLIMLAVAH